MYLQTALGSVEHEDPTEDGAVGGQPLAAVSTEVSVVSTGGVVSMGGAMSTGVVVSTDTSSLASVVPGPESDVQPEAENKSQAAAKSIVTCEDFMHRRVARHVPCVFSAVWLLHVY